jgi:phosphoenolpyruvate-protein phosphotransferase
MVAIVLVSHSAAVADAVALLARAIAGPDAMLESVGGSGGEIGADAGSVRGALERTSAVGGAVVLADVGSAVAAAREAYGLLPPDVAARVRLSSGPLVEGAVAAAVAAATGATLDAVAAEADGALAAKAASVGSPPGQSEATGGGWHECRILVTNPVGLHARPAARLVQTAAAWDAELVVLNATTGAGPASARSLTAIQTLGAMQGHELVVRSRGPECAEALDAIQALAARGFDEVAGPPPAMRFVPAGPVDGRGLIRGLPGAPGAAVGEARRLRRTVVRDSGGSGDPAVERLRLDRAFAAAREELRIARDAVAAQAGEEHAAIMDAQLLLLDDEAIVGPAREAVAAGVDAGGAIRGAVEGAAARLGSVEDGYLRARAEDIRQLARLLIGHLAGVAGPPRIRGRGILIAADLSPAETAALDLSMVEGIVVAGGGPMSHTAIIARGLGVPAVVGAGDMALTIVEETVLLVDGDAGTVTLDPSERAVADARARAARPDDALAVTGAVTRDGTAVTVSANVAGVGEARDAVAHGADGVGLFRTEFLLMNRAAPPDEDEQEAAYRAAAEGLDGRRLVLRTFDAGDDKPLPFLDATPGARGIRLALAHPELLRAQLRAILRVAADHTVAVMFPMVGDASELAAAIAELDLAGAELDGAGVRRGSPEVGTMIEVPSAAIHAAELAPHVAFFSVGTNDLTRYTLAADREAAASPGAAGGLHPAVAHLVGIVCRAARDAGVRVSVCGEAAADPLAIPGLLALGVRELSVAGPAVGATKGAVRDVLLAGPG